MSTKNARRRRPLSDIQKTAGRMIKQASVAEKSIREGLELWSHMCREIQTVLIGQDDPPLTPKEWLSNAWGFSG